MKKLLHGEHKQIDGLYLNLTWITSRKFTVCNVLHVGGAKEAHRRGRIFRIFSSH